MSAGNVRNRLRRRAMHRYPYLMRDPRTRELIAITTNGECISLDVI